MCYEEDGESVGVEIAKEVIEKTSDFVNGIIFHSHLTEYIFLKELYRIVIIARMLCIHISGNYFLIN